MIDVERCRAVLAACLPALAGGEIRQIGEGWGSVVFLLDADLVARFPKRAAVARTLEQESRLLPVLAPLLPTPIPSFLHVVRDCTAYPWMFVAYRRIPGVPADRAPPDDAGRATLAAEIGRLLRALHAFPLERAAALEIGPAEGALDPDRFHALAAWAREEVGPLLHNDEARRLAAWFESAEREGFLDHDPALVHADLGAEHLLVDPSGGGLTGLIDFGDAGIGDPALDVAGLLTVLGEEGVRTALAEYGRPDDEALLARARLHTQLFPLYDVRFGLASGEDLHVRAGLEGLRARMLGGRPRG